MLLSWASNHPERRTMSTKQVRFCVFIRHFRVALILKPWLVLFKGFKLISRLLWTEREYCSQLSGWKDPTVGLRLTSRLRNSGLVSSLNRAPRTRSTQCHLGGNSWSWLISQCCHMSDSFVSFSHSIAASDRIIQPCLGSPSHGGSNIWVTLIYLSQHLSASHIFVSIFDCLSYIWVALKY